MFCPSCGQKNQENIRFCLRCGKPVPSLTENFSAPDAASGNYDRLAFSYAGFWKRFAALLIDSLVLIIPSLILGAIIGVATVLIFGNVGDIAGAIGNIAGVLMAWLYFALMESSGKQATLGKLALGIKVVDLQGQRISFSRATGRYFAKILSSIILMIGYLMAGMTRRKQALHDMMASCLVINNDTSRGMPTWAVVVLVTLGGLVPIGGILAAIAIPAYQDYTIRSKVSMAIMSGDQAKIAVADFIFEHQKIPATLEEAGLTSAPPVGVKKIAIDNQTGAILVTMNFSPLIGKTLIFNPALDQNNNNIVWTCTSDDIPNKYLPASCRH